MESKRIDPDNGRYTLTGCKREVRGLIEKRIVSEAVASQLGFSDLVKGDKVFNKGFVDYLMKTIDYSLYYGLEIPSKGTHFANPDTGVFSITLLEYFIR